jgi:hypothetical protein
MLVPLEKTVAAMMHRYCPFHFHMSHFLKSHSVISPMSQSLTIGWMHVSLHADICIEIKLPIIDAHQPAIAST